MDADDLLGRVGSADPNLNMSGKFDERQTLLPDGTRLDKNHDGLLDGQLADRIGLNPDETQSAGQLAVDEDPDEPRPVTKRDIFKRREEILDKALISAVKTLA